MRASISKIIFLAGLGTLFSCNSSSSSFPTLSGSPEAATSSQKDLGESIEAVSGLYKVACGPTAQTKEAYLQEGNKSYGCAVLSVSDDSKFTGTVGNMIIKLNFNEPAAEETEASEEAALQEEAVTPTSEYVAVTLAGGDTEWHAFFQLEGDRYSEVTSISTHVEILGTPLPINVDDPHGFDPEGLK
jgi:hypothetical protein